MILNSSSNNKVAEESMKPENQIFSLKDKQGVRLLWQPSVEETPTSAMSSMLVITYNSSFEEVTSDDDFDKIEILSSKIDNSDEFFLAPVNRIDPLELELLHRKEKERKRVARVVALVSGILFLVSVALVAVSLYMSKDIDEMVRNSNEMLKKHNDRISGLQTGETATNFTGSQ